LKCIAEEKIGEEESVSIASEELNQRVPKCLYEKKSGQELDISVDGFKNQSCRLFEDLYSKGQMRGCVEELGKGLGRKAKRVWRDGRKTG
jgi:hypothetical protein